MTYLRQKFYAQSVINIILIGFALFSAGLHISSIFQYSSLLIIFSTILIFNLIFIIPAKMNIYFSRNNFENSQNSLKATLLR